MGGENLPMTIGEHFLVEKAKPLYQSKDFSLYALKLDSIQNNAYIRSAQVAYQQRLPVSKEVIHLSFDDEYTTATFYGPGAKLIHRGQTLVINQDIPTGYDTDYVFSAWSNIDYHQYGIAEWHLVIQDSLGQVLTELNTDTRKTNDIQDMWIRSELVFHAPKGSKILATVISNKDLFVDEVLIYPVHSTTVIDQEGSQQFLYNGYKVYKKLQ